MDIFWKTLAAALVSAILTLALDRQNRDFSLLVTVAACGMIAIVTAKFLSPVLDYLGQLESLGEMAAAVCTDAGNSSLARGLRFLSNAAILYLSIPIFSSLTSLLVQILGDV